jgi:hypothetical protein
VSRRRAVWIIGLGVAAVAVAVYVASRDRGSWPGGPRVTAVKLRRELERSGLAIRWRRGRRGDGVSGVVAGVASGDGRGRAGFGRVGFEFTIANGDHAEGGLLGRAGFPTKYRIPDNPCPRSPCKFVPPRWLPERRGVLGNVEYGVYHLNDESDELTINALDDALFASFPLDDPRAYPVLSKP